MRHYLMRRWIQTNSDCHDVAPGLPAVQHHFSVNRSSVDLTSGGHLWPPVGHLATVYDMPTPDERSDRAATSPERGLSESLRHIRRLEKRLRQLEERARHYHRGGWTKERTTAVLRAAARSGAASVIFGPQAGHVPEELSQAAERRSRSALEDAVEVVGQEMHRAMLAEATLRTDVER